jgi:hypothetical protein
MVYDRRTILKAAGAAGAASALPVGTALASEDCTESIGSQSFSGQLLVGAAAPAGANETTTGTFSTDGFADSEFESRRMDVTIESTGPSGFNWVDVDVEHKRDGEWVVIGAFRKSAPSGTIQVVDGEFDFDAEAEAVVADGEEYRFTIRSETNLDATVTWTISAEFVAFDADC